MTAAGPGAADLKPFRVVGVLAFTELCSGLVQGFVITLTPSLGVKLNIGAAELNWISVVQLLSTALAVPVFARLGDLFGHRRMLIIAVALLAVGSVLVALAPSWPLMLVGRFLQGALGCFLPLEFGLVKDRLPGRSTGTAVGTLVAWLTIGASLGLVLAGLLSVPLRDPQQVLLVPAALVVLALIALVFFVSESTTRAEGTFDVPGSVLFATGFGVLLVGIAQGSHWGWGAVGTIGCLVAGLALLGGFVLAELRTASPLIDIRLVGRSDLAPLYLGALVVGVAVFGAQTAGLTFIAAHPASAHYGFGLTALSIGLVNLLAMSLPMFVANLITGSFVSRGHGRGAVLGGFVVGALGYLLLLVAHGQLWQFLAASVIMSLGSGVVAAGMPGLIVDAAPQGRAGSTSAVYQLGRNVGGSIGGAIFAAVLASFTPTGTKVPGIGGYLSVWVVCGALFLVAAAAIAAFALVAPARRRSESTAPAMAAVEG